MEERPSGSWVGQLSVGGSLFLGWRARLVLLLCRASALWQRQAPLCVVLDGNLGCVEGEVTIVGGRGWAMVGSYHALVQAWGPRLSRSPGLVMVNSYEC
jgi:hypothetical protein